MSVQKKRRRGPSRAATLVVALALLAGSFGLGWFFGVRARVCQKENN